MIQGWGTGQMRTSVILLGSFLILFSSLGCGVTQSTTAIRDAERIHEEVIKEDTRAYAAYELAQGEAYLRRAKIAAGHSDHQNAIRMAQTARDAFIRSRDVAKQNKRRRYFRPYRLDWTKPVKP